MHLGLLTIPLSTVISWVAGALWYRLLGKPWLAALRLDGAALADFRAQSPLLPMAFSFIAELVMAVVIFIVVGGAVRGTGGLSRLLSTEVGVAVLWLGLVFSTIGVNYAFQRRSLSLLLIDGGHWLLVLLIQGAVIAGLG